MPTLEVQLEKAEKALNALRAERDEKLKSPTEGNKYAVAAFIKKDPKLADYRGIHVKIEAAKAKVRHLQDKLYNKNQKGGKTRRARGSKKTRRNL
jgi:CO dehydrogenase nickel-insertion accessory protein CooC1